MTDLAVMRDPSFNLHDLTAPSSPPSASQQHNGVSGERTTWNRNLFTSIRFSTPASRTNHAVLTDSTTPMQRRRVPPTKAAASLRLVFLLQAHSSAGHHVTAHLFLAASPHQRGIFSLPGSPLIQRGRHWQNTQKHTNTYFLPRAMMMNTSRLPHPAADQYTVSTVLPIVT